ncbi:ATP-binding cassette domain-containing protein, partial [Acinetobacter baumannii]
KAITIEQTVASGFFDTMGLYQSLNKEQKQILEQWIAFFGFSPIRYLSLSAVSTGEQRLALLARAFVKSPPLLVLDEPCQHLDEQHTQQV